MCVTSMVYDEYSKYPIAPWSPTTVPWPGPIVITGGQTVYTQPSQPTLVATDPLSIFEELVAVAARLDRALGLPDCEEPAKMEWLQMIKNSVREHAAAETEKRLAAAVDKK